MSYRSHYVASIWAGRKTILAVTAGSAIVMALLTMALPKLYIVRSVVDAGALPDVQPTELSLFVEAVDRNEFVVEGGRFEDSLTDSLSATSHPPSTIVLEARSGDPAGATQRLTVLTAGVLAELKGRFKAVKDTPDRRIPALLAEAAARVKTLIGLFDERGAAAVSLAVPARDAAARAAQQRDALRAAAASRYAELLGFAGYAGVPSVELAAKEVANWLRADEPAQSVPDVLDAELRRRPWIATLESANPVFSGLTAISAQLASADLQIISAVQARDAADALQEREGRALHVLSGSPVRDVASAARMKSALDDLAASYQRPSEAAALAQLREMSDVLANVAAGDADAQAALQRGVPHIATPPAMPTAPTWPRPIVNVAVAILFGLIGSTLFVLINSRTPQPDFRG